MFPKYKKLQGKRPWILLTLLLLGSIVLLESTASIAAPDSAPASPSEPSDANEIEEVVMSLSATGPIYATAGSNITYEVTLKNLTSKEITDIYIYNPIPTNTSYVSGGFFNSDESRVELMLSSLSAHATHSFTWVAKANNGLAVGTVIQNDALTLNDWVIGNESSPGEFYLPGTISTLIEAPGTLEAIYKDVNGTPFDVKVDGYGFENFTNESSRNFGDDLGAADLFMLFGEQTCETGNTAETCKLTGPAKKWLAGQIAGMNGGHCEGMAATSLRLFNWDPFKEFDSPASFQSGATTAIDLKFPEKNIENYIAYYFITQSVDEYYDKSNEIVDSPVNLIKKLKTDFALATPIPYTVGIYQLPGWKHGHAITAYGVEKVNDNESRILVYDNNFPKQRQYITVNTAANTWRYTTSATPGENATVYTGTATSGNLSLHANNSRDLEAGKYFTCPYCNSSSTRSTSFNADGVELIEGEITFEYSGEGSILVVNDEDQAIGTELDSGIFVEEIPGAELAHFKGGLGKDIPPRITIPFSEVDETYYTVYVHGNSVVSPTHGVLTIVGAGFSVGVNNIELDAGEVFEFSVSPDGDHISFKASETVDAPSIYIAHDPVSDEDPSVIFDVEDVQLFANETVYLDLDPELERIYFEDTGGEDEQFEISMSLIWPDGDEEDFTESVHIPAGSTSAFIDFGAWDGLGHPPIYIDDVLSNPSINHRLKLVSSTNTFDATPKTNAPAGVYSVEATFQNVTEITLEDVYFTVANIAEGNLLLNADGAPAGKGGEISVPAAALGGDGILGVNETFTVTFEVGLAEAGTAVILVDSNGAPHDWAVDVKNVAYDAQNASFTFSQFNRVFLPLIGR